MLYPFVTLSDGTEIVHSEVFIENGEKKVKVVIEKPVYGGFQHAECYLPEYRWDAVEGFSKEEIEYYEEYIRSLAHVIINKNFNKFLVERFQIERKKRDRSGVYGYTQRLLAYNSNKIEGSTLTEEQTASLFDTGILPKTEDYYRAKDVEEMNGHFLMFNFMLDTLGEELTENLIKRFHYELKSGVFEDRANGYAIGGYKERPNIIGIYQTTKPDDVRMEMAQLMEWYSQQDITLSVLADFHARFESIHPFQDGNGRTGRLILFRECLKNGLVPVLIEDVNRQEYLEALRSYRQGAGIEKLEILFEKEQGVYLEKCEYFIPTRDIVSHIDVKKGKKR